MKAPEKWSPNRYGDTMRGPAVPATPVVYPLDDHVKESLLGPDGKPVTEAGTRRKHPIGFHRQAKS